MGETERRLVWLARAGDREAFSELVSLFESRVYRAACALTGNKDDAADLSQETFIRAFRGIGRFRGRSSFFTWLYRILLNSFKTLMREKRRRPEAPSRNEGNAAVEQRADRSSPDWRVVSHRETVDRVYKEIASLPDEQRIAIVMLCLEGMSYREIAGAMGCSIGTVKSRIHAARLALKEKLLHESK